VKRLACIVVGGGPAGLSTALFLAHGAPELTSRIVVLEKERYPREKFCAGAVGARADRALASIGVTVDVPSVPISGLLLSAMGRSVLAREEGAGRVVRRIEFDHALAEAARARKIRVSDGVRATGIRVGAHGVAVETSAGLLEADVVVGADGVGSMVRKATGAPRSPYLAQAIEVDTEPLPGDRPRDVLVFDVSRREITGYAWEFPTLVDGREMVCRGVYALKADSRNEAPDIEQVLAEELEARGLELRRYRKKRYAERGFHGRGPGASRRVLLAGEAFGIDPVTGEGIAQAIQFGAAAGAYLARKIRARDFFFYDWERFVRSTSVGRDLVVRSSLVNLAYGAHRAKVERFLVDSPEFLEVGLQHFAGHPWSKRAVGRSLARGGATLLREIFSPDALSSPASGALP